MSYLNTRLKFLFLSTDTFPPKRVDVAVLFGKKIVHRGHIIDWVLQSEDSCKHAFKTKWNNCDVWVGPTTKNVSLFARLKRHFYRIKHDLIVFKLVKNNDYDFLLIKDKFISAVFGLFAAKRKGIKFIYWLSYPFPEVSIYEYKQGIARYPIFYFIRGKIFSFLLYKIILPQSTHVFVQSEQMKLDVASNNISPNKITSVPMGFSIEEIKSITKVKKISSKAPLVVYLGTLGRIRKIDFLVRVTNKLCKTYKDINLYLVGDGERNADTEIIYNQADKFGIHANIHITGFLPRDEALQIVASADVCVSPFFPTPILNSTSPTKLIEYMAMGRPVVANEHPEQRQIIKESGGGLCVAYDEEAFSQAIIQILNNPLEAEKMGLKGQAYVENHREYNLIAKNLEQKLYEICEGN